MSSDPKDQRDLALKRLERARVEHQQRHRAVSLASEALQRAHAALDEANAAWAKARKELQTAERAFNRARAALEGDDDATAILVPSSGEWPGSNGT